MLFCNLHGFRTNTTKKDLDIHSSIYTIPRIREKNNKNIRSRCMEDITECFNIHFRYGVFFSSRFFYFSVHLSCGNVEQQKQDLRILLKTLYTQFAYILAQLCVALLGTAHEKQDEAHIHTPKNCEGKKIKSRITVTRVTTTEN